MEGKKEILVVTCAYDGTEALEIVKEKGFDLILLDIMLPKMNGMEVCRTIREFYDTPMISPILL